MMCCTVQTIAAWRTYNRSFEAWLNCAFFWPQAALSFFFCFTLFTHACKSHELKFTVSPFSLMHVNWEELKTSHELKFTSGFLWTFESFNWSRRNSETCEFELGDGANASIFPYVSLELRYMACVITLSISVRMWESWTYIFYHFLFNKTSVSTTNHVKHS